MASKQNNPSVTVKNGGSSAKKATAQQQGDAPTKQKQTAKFINNMKEMWEKFLKHAEEYSDYDTIIQERDDLRKQLDNKNKELEKKDAELTKKDNELEVLRQAREIQTNELLVKYDQWKDGNAAARRAADAEKEKMKKDHADEMQEARNELDKRQGWMDSLRSGLELTKKELKLARDQIAICEERLLQWERYLVHFKPVNLQSVQNLKARIDSLYQSCYRIVCEEFYVEISEDVQNKPDEWENKVRDLAVSFWLPPTNSEAAKLARVAAAMHLIANHLYSVVFRPLYIPGLSNCNAAIDEILYRQLPSDRTAALVMRGILLSTNKPEDLRNSIQKEAHVGKEMLLNKLAFMSKDVCISFLGKFDRLLNEAAGLWTDMQYLEQMVKVGIVEGEDPEFYDWDWLYVEQFGQPPPPGHPEDIVGLFPAFYLPEEGLDISQGCALWKGQDQIKTAHKEWKEFQKSKTKAHGFVGHRRKPSMNNYGGNGQGSGSQI